MWTPENRGTYDHKTKRDPSDLTDGEPHLPPPTKGRPHRALDRREVMNAILYVLTTGCQWRQLPRDFSSKSAVHKYLIGLQHDGVLMRIHDALYGKVREEAGKAPAPTLSIVDRQSVKSAEKGGAIVIRMATMRARKSRQEAPNRRRYTGTDVRPRRAARRLPGATTWLPFC
jgi:transposase